MVARLHEHAPDRAPDHTTDDAANETAEETVASVCDRLVEGSDSDQYGSGRQESAKWTTLR